MSRGQKSNGRLSREPKRTNIFPDEFLSVQLDLRWPWCLSWLGEPLASRQHFLGDSNIPWRIHAC